MALRTEYVYIGRDNRIDLRLKADLNDGNGMQYQDLSSVTRVDMIFDATTVTSTNQATDPIRWAVDAGYQTGEIRISIGDESIDAGEYRAPLIVYDPSNTDGILWGYVPVVVKDV